MLRKILSVVALLALPSLASAQVFDPNLLYTAGVLYSIDKPVDGSNRYQFALTQSLPGIRIAENFLGSTWYTLSPGFTVHTVDVATGTATGLAVALGGVTVQPRAGKFVIQAGVTRDVTGGSKGTHAFFTIGGSLTSYTAIKAKRVKKAEEKAKKAAELLLSHPPGSVAGK